MFCDPVVFGHNWANAAATAMEVVRLRVSNSNIDGNRPGTLTEVGETSFTYSLPTDKRRWRRPIDGLIRRRVLLSVHDQLARRFGPFDAAAVHFFVRAGSAAVLRRSRNVPVIVIEHSSALTGRNPEQMRLPEARKKAARAYRQIDGIAFVSHDLEHHARRLGVVPPRAKVAVVPNPVDTTVFRPPPCEVAVRPLEIVCVARLAPVKRQRALIEALDALRRRGIDARLTLVGDGPERQRLEQRAHQLGVAEHTVFTGWQPPGEIARILQQSHVFALPSITENLPFAIIEAMCTGLPVAATPVGGVPDLLDGHPSALLTDVDPQTIADAVCQLARVPVERAAVAEAAAERFGYAAVGAQLERFVRSVT